jgi:hypothetical protein
MTETNSEHITSLISLVKSQNKSLQSLQSQVYKLQEKLEAEDSERRDAECSDTEEDTEKVEVREIFCDLCEDQHTALYHCKDCSENLCETIAGIHKKGKATKGHLVLLLSDIEKEPDVDESYEVPIYKETVWDAFKQGPSKIFEGSAIDEIISFRKGKLHIKDNFCNHIYVFSKNGDYIEKMPLRSRENLLDEYDFKKEMLTFSIELSSDIRPPQFDSGKISVKGEIFIVDTANHIVKVFSKEGKFIRTIGKPAKHIYETNDINQGTKPMTRHDNGEFDFNCFHISHTYVNPKSNIIKFSAKGEVIIRDSCKIQVFSQDGLFLYKIYESRNIINCFSLCTETGDIIITNDRSDIHILEVTGKYTRKPKETHFTLNTTLVQDSEILKDTNVSSVTFPISIKRDANDNLFTRTLYFPQPIPVKVAIHEVEEYFRKRITREEFKEVRSVCNFSSLQGELRGEYMNWDSCKKAKVIRGYFLGGEIIDELTLDGGNLFLHITDCFVSLK